MYKVFNDNSLIILNSKDVYLSTINDHYYVINTEEFVKSLNLYFTSEVKNDVLFYGYDTEKMFADMQSYFEYIEAAGGIVENSKGEVLLINRFGFWDFPKGKIERGETSEIAAIREVEEETGVEGLEITSKLNPTYHIYYHNDKRILKKTYWFEMRTIFNGKLVPQTNEDIEQAVWRKKQNISVLMQDSYRSLRDNFKEFFNH